MPRPLPAAASAEPPQRTLAARAAGWLRGLTRFVITLAVLSALAAATAAALWFYAQRRADEEIRNFVEARLRQQYGPLGLECEVASARLVEGKGIAVYGLKVRDTAAPPEAREPLLIEELFLETPIRLEDLLQGPPALQRIVLRRPRLRLVRGRDGVWSLARLWPPPEHGGGPTPLCVQDGSLEIVDLTAEPPAEFRLDDVSLDVVCRPLSNGQNSRRLTLSGSARGDHFHRLTLEAELDPDRQAGQLAGRIEGLALGPNWRGVLPREAAEPLAPLDTLRGVGAVQFEAALPGDGAPPQYAVSLELDQGTFDHPRLPYPLTRLSARVRADQDGLTVDQLQARCGAAWLRLAAERRGHAPGSPLVVIAQAEDVALDERLAQSLPPELREGWEMFSPSGVIRADLRLEYADGRWRPTAHVECLDVGFAYSKFPYQLNGGRGVLHWENERLDIDLSAVAAGRTVRFRGAVDHPGPGWTGGVDVSLDGPIPLDEKLLAALEPPTQRLVRSLHPRGMLSVEGRFERKRPDQGEHERRFLITLHDCAMQYDRFPYPLERIRGVLELHAGVWTFRTLEGRNDSGYVVCEGGWRPTENREGILTLSFIGTDMALEDELRRALPAGAQRIWSDLRPRGTLDHVKAVLLFDSATKLLDVEVWAQKWKQSQNVEGRSIAVEPKWLPYRLEQVTGKVHYHQGVVELEQIAAQHGRTRISLGGRCEFDDAGAWRVACERITADRLQADHDLTAALPASLGAAVERLKLRGPLSLMGSVTVSGGAAPEAPLASQWDLLFDLEDGRFDWQWPVTSVRGGVRLWGKQDARGVAGRGELALDSASVQGLQFTQLRGPLAFTGQRLWFGAAAGPGPDGAPQPISARALGGLIEGGGELSLEGDARFRLNAALADGDLPQIAGATGAPGEVRGKVSGGLELEGALTGLHTIRGQARAQLREADVYQAPAMLDVLKLASVRPPDSAAFTSADMECEIQGDHVYFQRLDFRGDAISLRGRGEMDLNRQLNVYFYAMVGRDEVRIPLLSQLAGRVSSQLLLIHATGPLHEPALERLAFPGLNQALQDAFPEAAEEQASGMAGLPQLPSLWPPGGSRR